MWKYVKLYKVALAKRKGQTVTGNFKSVKRIISCLIIDIRYSIKSNDFGVVVFVVFVLKSLHLVIRFSF